MEGIWNSKRGGLLQRYRAANCHRKWGLVVLESGGISFKRDFQHAREGGIEKKGKKRSEKTQPGRRTILRVEKTHSLPWELSTTSRHKKNKKMIRT